MTICINNLFKIKNNCLHMLRLCRLITIINKQNYNTNTYITMLDALYKFNNV